MPVVVTVAVEGPSDEAVAKRLLHMAGFAVGPIHGLRGKGLLDKNLRGYNQAAQQASWLVLRDLNGDANCAPEMVTQLLPKPASGMRFRLAVRAVESWLMGDREEISRFLSIPLAKVCMQPETLQNPKHILVGLARRSRSKAIREDMVPRAGTSAQVGPGYVARVIEFAGTHWRPQAAARNCESLRRCIESLKDLR